MPVKTKRAASPRKKATTTTTTTTVTTTVEQKQLINHVAKIVDESGSINDYRLTNGVIKTVNDGTKDLAADSAASGQATYLSLYLFGPFAKPATFFEANPATAPRLSHDNYNPGGGTAMLDAIGLAIQDFEKIDTSKGDHAFVIEVTTDGEENSSTRFKVSRSGDFSKADPIYKMMQEKMALGNWTFAFSVPRGHYRQQLSDRFHIPLGNIQEWDTTDKGLDVASQATRSGMKSYFAARSTGTRASSSFYETDLSKVTKKDLQKNLEDVTNLFRHFKVEKEVEIRPFVEAKTGQTYTKGSSYYELMKVEKVQDHKKILIQERKGGKLWGGPGVRGMLAMPTTGEIRVHPGNHGDFRIFVESTSVNRKLVRGTTVLVVQ